MLAQGCSVVEQGHVSVPDREHQEQKRKWHMNEKPGVQPMMKACLQVEHPALVAPRLDFLYPASISFRDTQLHEAEGVI
jgi:hypothetical protein